MSRERTLVVIKPDGVQRNLVGEIIKRLEQAGLKLVGIKMMHATAEFVEKHYTLDPEWRRITGEKTIKGYEDKGLEPPSRDPYEITGKILDNLKRYMTAGPVIAMIWEGVGAVKIVRKITGSTEPFSSPMGTLRGDFCLDSYQLGDETGRAVRNLVHASGSPAEADPEINFWFSADELFDYNLGRDGVMYAKEMEGIWETKG